MKKLLLLITVVLFISCSSDEESDNGITLEPNQKTLYFEDTYQIEASSISAITYSVENEFHASVSSTGLVEVGRVGETTIILDNGEETKEEIITVTPKSTLYPTPNLEFGISRSQLEDSLGTPDAETDESILYTTSLGYNMLYLFDDDNNLDFSSVIIEEQHTSELVTYLGERYLLVSDTDEFYMLINGLSMATSTLAIGASEMNDDYLLVLYSPIDDSTLNKSSNTYKIDSSLINKISKILKNKLNN
ncbi:Ig-like domain-containing protein [Flavicella sp.]|uniref:Ig-like domain-containing protein n=1 Tax=Flavicella sp. TaxID=2957742 RepID=UPI0030185F70